MGLPYKIKYIRVVLSPPDSFEVEYLSGIIVSVHDWECSEGSYLLAILSPDKNVSIGQYYQTLDYVQCQRF